MQQFTYDKYSPERCQPDHDQVEPMMGTNAQWPGPRQFGTTKSGPLLEIKRSRESRTKRIERVKARHLVESFTTILSISV